MDEVEQMTSVIAGLAGGFVATIVMTTVMMVMGDGGPPPTAGLLAKYAGGDASDYALPGMVLHFIYGTIAGAVFAIGASVLGFDLNTIGLTIGLGILYGLILMVGGMVFWVRMIIGMEPDREMKLTFAVVHVVYGLVLGAFLGAGLLN